RGGAQLRPGDRAGRAARSAGRSGSGAGLPGRGQCGRPAPAPARRRRGEGRVMDFDWLFLAEVVLAGLGAGGLYALAGLAFVIVYKATRVVNLAIGEMLMLGAFLFYTFAALLEWPVWLSLLLTVALSGLIGGAIGRLATRPMLGEPPISTFMVTVGLSSIIVGLVELIWGADQRRLPEFMPGEPVFIGEA